MQKLCIMFGHRNVTDSRKRIQILLTVGIVLVGACLWVSIRHYAGKTVVYKDAAEIICHFEQAIKEVNAEAEKTGEFRAEPISYLCADGSTIHYYCCHTTYFTDPAPEYSGLDMSAFELMIDYPAIENRRSCEVNGLEAFQCKIGERAYLCWTISPTMSCVIEYAAGSISDEDIFQMAEIVQEPDNKEE